MDNGQNNQFKIDYFLIYGPLFWPAVYRRSQAFSWAHIWEQSLLSIMITSIQNCIKTFLDQPHAKWFTHISFYFYRWNALLFEFNKLTSLIRRFATPVELCQSLCRPLLLKDDKCEKYRVSIHFNQSPAFDCMQNSVAVQVWLQG